jgi:putative inorganic carbon (hco3(-)) transporter
MPNPETIRLILLILSLALFVCAFKRPFYGVVSYLIIMMTRPGVFYPALESMRIELVIGLANIFIMIAGGRLKHLDLKGSQISKWLFILLIVMLLSMFQAFDFSNSWLQMNEFIKIYIFFLMIVTMTDTRKDIEVLLIVFGVVTCAIGYDAIYNYHQGIVSTRVGLDEYSYAVTSGGMGSGHVALANLTLQGMPILWYLTVYKKPAFLKLMGISLFLVCIYAVIISGSRGGFIGLIALFLLITIFSKRKVLMLSISLILFVSVPFIAGTGYMNYISTIKDIGTSAEGVSTDSRISGLRNGFEMMLRRPLLGVGPGCYPLARKAWFGWGLWAHNLYGELMGDLGLPGTIIWFTFLYSFLKQAFILKKIRSDQSRSVWVYDAVIVATILRLILGMTTHSVYIFFWYMMAAIIAVEERIFKEEKTDTVSEKKHSMHRPVFFRMSSKLFDR